MAPNFLFPIFLLLLIVSLAECNGQDELILVQALWRHGDRTPIGTFESDPYQEDHWDQGFGELTPRGMKQHVHLGKRLRKRYITDLGFVSPEYKNHEIYVRSTDLNRTLISAISNLIGFYGPGKDEAYPKELGTDWPGWFLPIAVHTRAPEEDYVNRPPCKRHDQLQEHIKKAPEYQQKLAKYKPYLDFLNEKTGLEGTDLELNLFNAWWIWDLFYVEKGVYKLKLMDWVENNQTLVEMITQMNHEQQQLFSGFGLSPLDGVDFVKESARLHGGALLWILIDNLRDKLNCHKTGNSVKENETKGKSSPLGTPLCKWMNRMRYFAYSVHDVTIASLFSALGFPKTDHDRDGYPHYSACLTLELWKEAENGKFKIKLFYWRPDPEEEEPREITSDISGCPKNGTVCTLEKFVERSRLYELLPSPKEYCQKPLFGTANSAMSAINNSPLGILFLAIFSMLLTKTELMDK